MRKNDTTLSESFLRGKSQRVKKTCIPMINLSFNFVFLAERPILG